MEPEQGDQRLAVDLLHLAGFGVLDRHAGDRAVAVNLAHLAGSQDLDAPLRLERTGLVDRRLERAELVPPMDEHDRRAGGVLEPERPVERGIAAPDDHAGLVLEDVLLAHDVVEALALPLVDPFDPELPRLEGAVTGGDDHRSRQVGAALLRRQRQELLAVLD